MDFIFFIVEIIEILLFIWLGFCTLYIAVLSVSGCFYQERELIKLSINIPRILVLIPAYKEDQVIIETAQKVTTQDYPLYDVIVIADSLQKQTLNKLKETNVEVLEVHFDKSTKTKAINAALNQIDVAYDLVVILDSDNVMDKGVLTLFAQKFKDGTLAIQGHRTAKNTDSGYAILDAISEEMNNHIHSKGAQTVGLTSRVIGSGMAFEFHLFKKLMSEIEAVGGFDKVLQLKLIESGNMISYLENAHVFDEKVGSQKVFSNQRKRWASSQYIYLKMYFWKSIKKLFKGNYNYFMILITYVFPPRILLPVLLFGLFLISFFFKNNTFTFLWGITFLILVFSYTLAVPKRLIFSKHFWAALKALPSAIAAMSITIFKLKGANETFIHTPHSSNKNKK